MNKNIKIVRTLLCCDILVGLAVLLKWMEQSRVGTWVTDLVNIYTYTLIIILPIGLILVVKNLGTLWELTFIKKVFSIVSALIVFGFWFLITFSIIYICISSFVS